MGKLVFTLITKLNCPWCMKAKLALNNAGHLYKEMQIGKDITTEQVKKNFPTQTMVPIVLMQSDPDAPRNLLGSYDDLMKYLNTMNGGIRKDEQKEGGSADCHGSPCDGDDA